MFKYLLDTNIVIYVIKKRPIELMGVFNQNANHSGSDQGFDLNMSRGDISSYLSISREEISRILQKLENSGLIFVKNRHIALLNILCGISYFEFVILFDEYISFVFCNG